MCTCRLIIMSNSFFNSQYVNLIDLTKDSDESDSCDEHLLPIVNVKSNPSEPR